MKLDQGPEDLRFGGGLSETVLNPTVLVVILIAGVLIFSGQRKTATVAFIAASLLVPMDQVLLIGSLHFPMLRVLILFGIARMIKDKVQSRLPIFSGGMNKIDAAVILVTIFTALSGILLFQESAAVVNQLGNLYTVFGAYFLLRFLLRNEQDAVLLIRGMAYIAAFVALIMAYEFFTGHNPYALLGGARASIYETLAARDDRFRAQGPFGHSILAGTFGAVLLPLFFALWWKDKKSHKLAVVGVLSSTVIALTCNSSTPLLAYAAGVIAFCMWPARTWMRAIRWGTVATLTLLHLVMKAPVWNLIARIDLAGGSSGYHRYMLIDQCIRHFGDWWLMGVKDTSVWGWDMWDTANQYVGTADNSGLLPFILFVAVLVYGFRYLARARNAVRNDKQSALAIWALSAALFANAVAFFGISYWDQSQVAWYGLLAMISAVFATQRKRPMAQVSAEAVSWPSIEEQQPVLIEGMATAGETSVTRSLGKELSQPH